MNQVFNRLCIVAAEVFKLLPVLDSKFSSTGRLKSTDEEYMQIAQRLIRRAGIDSSALVAAVQDTSRPTTFYKRLAALKHYLRTYAGNFSTLNVLPETEWPQSIDNLYKFKYLLEALDQ